MRFTQSFPVILLSSVVFSFGISAGAQAGDPGIFAADISLGSSGKQVVLIQRILNREQETRVANTGPGSPGNETEYFGLLTKAAVARFQEKYASEVLSPVGLKRGSGYIGFYTRAKLSAIFRSTAVAGSTIPAAPSVASSSLAVEPPPSIISVSTTTPQNPNLKNLDKFLAAVERAAAKKGLSTTELTLIKEQIVKRAATTTDMRAAFLELVKNKPSQSAHSDSFMDRIFTVAGRAFSAIFKPERAQALTGVPFGGALLDAFYCEDSATWLITVEPLPPSYAALLTYVPGSQAYLSYNIPFTEWLLGEYAPGAGVCIVACPYCVYIPSEGMITPMTGSSLI
ncbi:MAG: hypothetical protein WC835_00945 [Candidatus Paceibacterota bacterium]|jgi:hypothetical protein